MSEICNVCYRWMADHPPGPLCVPIPPEELTHAQMISEYRRLRRAAEELRLFIEGVADFVDGRTKPFALIQAQLRAKIKETPRN